MISEKEWRALPEEEKQRRRKEFEAALRAVLNPYDKETIKAALQGTLKELRAKARSKR